MTIRYTLDLTKEEYRDDFVALDEPTESNDKEFWQYEARDKLVEKLSSFLNDAKKYKQARSKNKSKTWLSHNAILVTGQRGTGKTVFLRNCEAMWDVHCKKMLKSQSEIYFLESIDPTMLIEQDNFANVIIAQIYSEVEAKLNSENNCNVNEGLKSDFYKKLKKLADALGKKEEFEGCSGIDKVLQYKSGINVERYFHDFVESAIINLDTEAFALPIDDVDMALDRAYEVVDEVRRLLGCPYIIPIVSGDYSLYEQMVHVHFDEKAYQEKTKNEELKAKGINLSNNLTDAYLTKVFPNNMRISLLPIDYISPMLFIKTASGEGTYPYRKYVESLQSQFYPLCSNENILKNWPKPESARELVQFTRTVLPHELELAHKNTDISYKLWKSYINWAEQKQNGQAYVNVDSYLTVKNRNIEDIFNISDLLSFNPKAQIKQTHLNWADKPFLKSQLYSLGLGRKATERGIKSTQQLKKNLESGGWLFDNLSLIEFGFNEGDKTLSSLPPLEFFHLDSMVTQKEAEKAYELEELICSKDSLEIESDTSPTQVKCCLNGLLLDIYTYGDLYSTMGNSYQYVVISRAFELIVYSFLMKDEENSTSSLVDILSRRAFYSVFNVAPTKTINSGEDEDIENIKMPINANKLSYAMVLGSHISAWRKTHSVFFNNIQSEKLLPIFSFMFNKVFTAFHSFKFENYIGSNTVDREYLTDHIRRFELMTLNSAYTAMIKGESIEANVGITNNQATIRSKKLFKRRDRTLNRNMARFNSQFKEPESIEQQFIRALESHPLFEIIKSESNDDIVIKQRIKLGKISLDKNLSVGGKSSYFSKNQIKFGDVKRLEYRLPERLTLKAKGYLEKHSEYYDTVKATKKELVPAIENDLMAYDYFESDFNDKSINFDDLNIISGNKAHNFIKVLYDINKSGKS
ncbi:hypothetical protein A2I96_06010 [Pseudoalteromonas tetraodonis]|uniref:ATP-binding protein n=1 Tax=Pseudoalteromonas tetraodonis TaxID=43659 RepID=A0ABD4ESV5_9GAMM|nr:antiviral RADAR system adenosine triphosphatase RdrA [Pseudoalteromonas spiralis]KYL37199.1 hypothetical protein A2I96_06010 [Pseudoalteromonas spiralis]